jgi:rhodanese-related sulfurtransferase
VKRVISAVIASALMLAGCSSSNSAVTDLGAKEFVSQSQAVGVVVIDVRTPGEFSEGHLVNALNLDVQSSSFQSDIASLDKTTTYALYCRSGNRSGVAAEIMAEAGFTKILNAKVGFVDLVQSGAIPA